jgi:hypothetical protein
VSLAAAQASIEQLGTAISQTEDRLAVELLQVELHRLDLAADSRRLELLLGDAREPMVAGLVDDQSLDSQQAAAILGRSLNWIYHHRGLLQSALASAPDARPRYSKRLLDRLRRSWSSITRRDE